MTDSERKILAKLDTLEEAMKMLLVNDILKDAENLTGQNQVSVRQHELQSKIDELQKRLKEKETEISKLLSQLETQKGRIKTLQDMSGSKDRTIQTKEERIQILQQSVKTKDDSISRLQSQIEKQQMEIESLQQTIDELEDYDYNDDSNSVYYDSDKNSEYIEKAKEMGAYRMGAAFRLPSGYCKHANGRVWRIVGLHGEIVTLRRSHSSHTYEENFYVQEILRYYEPI